MITTKTNLLIDKIVRGVAVNKNQEIDYTADITVDLDKDIYFEYAIVDEGAIDDPNVNFTQARKRVTLKHVNSDGIYKKKVLLIKSLEKSSSQVTVDVERLIVTSVNSGVGLETLGPRGTVFLNSAVPADTAQTPWYKNPVIIAVIIGIVLLVAMFAISKRKGSNPERSMFID